MTTPPTELEKHLLSLINAARARAGAAPLTFDPELMDAARRHTVWMVETDSLSHTGSAGSSPSRRATAAGYGWRSVAENIAYVSGRDAAVLDVPDVERLHANLMNSAGHRANLLNAAYTDLGVGLVQGDYRGRPAVFLTELFGRPNAAEAAEPDAWNPLPPPLRDPTDDRPLTLKGLRLTTNAGRPLVGDDRFD